MGRLFGIEVKVHLLLIAWAIPLAWNGVHQGSTQALHAIVWILFLFACVFLHEMGHCFAAIRSGLQAEEILLWPLGGLATITGRRNRPGETILVAAAGPAVNLVLCAAIWSALFASGNPPPFSLFGWPTFLHGLFRVNLVLLCFNLLPAIPLDGGRILQGILAIRMGFGPSVLLATRIGQIAAVGVGLWGLNRDLWWDRVLMLGIAIWMFGQAWFERRLLQEGVLRDESESTFGYDFSGGYATLQPPETQERPSWFARRRERRRRRKAIREAARAAAMRRRVDELLEKVGKGGVATLTAAEKRFLEEASRKFRAGP